jgi:hypothetical protein
MARVFSNELRLVESCSGVGRLTVQGQDFDEVRYKIDRFQGMTRAGLPVPGIHRIEGKLDLSRVPEDVRRIGMDSTLRLEDGRTLRLAIASEDGDVLTEGHGPSRCTCC